MAAYRVISFDGGGIRGVVTLKLLQRLERARPGLLSRTELFAGTSTGGIIALGLAAGKTTQELLDLYALNGQRIFDNSWLRDIVDLGDIAGAQYDSANLQQILQTQFNDLTLAQLQKRVLIPSFDLDYTDPQNPASQFWSPKFFHNFPGSDSDAAQRVVDVAMATSAAPTYFPSHGAYIDGGVLANNPTMAAVAQTQDSRALIDPRPGLNDLLVLSLGTGTVLSYISGENHDWGLAQWAKPLVSILFDASMDIADYQCRQLLRDRYRRIAPAFPQGVNIKMDDWQRVQELINFGANADLGDAPAWLQTASW